jgi:DNA-binding NarL/FixJ family response regulator
MKRVKVLLVDSHDRFRHSVASFLNEQGFVDIVGEAINGDEAIVQTEQLRPDLVLLDPGIRERDGFEATREIKLRAPGTKVVILSMHGDDAYRKMAWRHAADGFIEKSSLKSALLDILLSEQQRLSIQALAG